MASRSGEVPVDDPYQALRLGDDDVVGRETMATDRAGFRRAELPARRLGRGEASDGVVAGGERSADVLEQRLIPDPGRPRVGVTDGSAREVLQDLATLLVQAVRHRPEIEAP